MSDNNLKDNEQSLITMVINYKNGDKYTGQIKEGRLHG